MLSVIRKRMTYANVAVTLALVFAMSGGAYAASRYVITSTKQISPKVLKSLQGKAGPAGKNGANGANGAQGAQGPAGAAGAKGEPGPQGSEGKEGKQGIPGTNGTTGFTETLPEGKTEKGDWSVGVESAPVGLLFEAVSFDIPLEKAPVPIYVKPHATTPEHCTGDVQDPGAEAGYLCVFASEEQSLVSETALGGIANPKVCSNTNNVSLTVCDQSQSSANPPAADPTGFDLTVIAEEQGYADGTWAVSAE